MQQTPRQDLLWRDRGDGKTCTTSCAFCQDSDSTDYGKIHLAKKAFIRKTKKKKKKKEKISSEYQD